MATQKVFIFVCIFLTFVPFKERICLSVVPHLSSRTPMTPSYK